LFRFHPDYSFAPGKNICQLEKLTSIIYFIAFHHLEDIEFLKVVNRIFSILPDFVALLWALRIKHIENIHEIAFWGPQNIF
jgi:hypothetical protein